MYAINLKNITAKVGGVNQLRQIIVFTHESQYAVIEISDPNFIDPACFLKEQSLIYFENLTFCYSMNLQTSDLSFTIS